MRTYEQIVAELDAKIPRDVIEERDGGGGRKLSYLAGHYVIDRLNKVLGQGNWSYSSEVTLIHSGVIQDRYGKDVHSVHYSARVDLLVKVEDKQVRFVDYGYGDGTDKSNPGKAHELAIKESITDGIKRCAKNLGMSMGLALYSKDQENVDDGEVEIRPSGGHGPVRSGSASKAQESVGGAKEAPSPKQSTPKEAHSGAGTTASKDDLIETINQQLDIARAKKKSDLTKEYFTSLGLNGRDQLTTLTVEQLSSAMEHLKGIIHGK